jgi:HD superfamily phosphohydrolase
MHNAILDIPEVAALDARRHLVRIPPQLDVPLTERVRRTIDTAAFRRLARISQLGLVSLVYPAANHSRFEHSLGVYRLALLYLKRLAYDKRFVSAVDAGQAQVFIAAALLHDLGHWPFCHPIEDMNLPDVPRHETLAESFLCQDELCEVLRRHWQIDPQQVVALLAQPPRTPAERLLKTMLDGPIDIDKMDYLFRDSLHAGVPYGRNFDQQRLLGSLCLNSDGQGLAITEKGKTAAELMVFARYVMFSEVYWHHAVRAATAMLQRAFYRLYKQLDLSALFRLSEAEMVSAMMAAAGDGPAAELLAGLFGPRRQLYKRVAQYSLFENGDLYQQLARRPYHWLARCAEEFAGHAGAALKQAVAGHELLFDAPPVAREVEFNVEIFYQKENRYRRLGDVSPVIATLAREQFDDYVKRVRIFAHPRIAADLRRLPELNRLVERAVASTGEA